MTEHIRVQGARSSTLLGYLKALGLLRIVGEQVDPTARGRWRDGVFVLRTASSRPDLEEFLLDRWVPTPVVSPWNGGSGFFPKDNVAAFSAIDADGGSRLEPFRSAIRAAREILDSLEITEKPDSKTQKADLLRMLRAALPDDALPWIDTAAVLLGEMTAYPPLLGSGGNDGRYDIANNYAQAVVAALGLGVRGATPADWLSGCLDGTSVRLEKLSLAHLFRDASPVNSPAGAADALGNPWDLVLAVTGTLILGSGAARRMADGARASLVAPFTFAASSAGYGSAVAQEKGKAEVWLPTWDRPASLREIEAMFREARARIGDRAARTGLDATRAAGELGVARGIVAFERYSILERAGLSNLAVHAGRIEVAQRAGARALRTLDPWLSRVINYGSGDAPRAHREVVRRLERAAFALAERDSPDRAVEMIVALGATESVLARSAENDRPAGLRPPFPQAAPWLELLETRLIEHRVAVAIASSRDRAFAAELPTLRHYLHGTGRVREVDQLGYGVATAGRPPPDATIAARLAAVVERRCRDAAGAARALPFDYGLPLSLADVARFATSRESIDDRLLGDLVDGLVTFDFREVITRRPAEAVHAPATIQTIALAVHDPGFVPFTSDRIRRPDEERCVPRPDWAAWLRAGRDDRVVADALLRLRLAGLPQIATTADLRLDVAASPRLAALLLVPPSLSDLRRATDQLTDVARPNLHQETPA